MGLRRGEVTWQCRKLHNEELYDLYSPKKKTRTVRINATLRRVRVTIIAVKKQQVLHLMYVCPCIIYEIDERYPLDATIYLLL